MGSLLNGPVRFGCLAVGLLFCNVAAAQHGSTEPAELRLSAANFHATDRQLGDLIEELLGNNSDVAVAAANWRASRSMAQHGRALPDPEFRYTWWASPPETRVGPQRHTFELSQRLPWKGKRRAQVQQTERAASGVGLDAEALARTRVAALKTVYFEIAYVQEAMLLNGEERELLGRFESIALKRYSTGKGIQQTIVKIQTEISRLEDQRSELRQRLEVGWARIAELLGRSMSEIALWPVPLPIPDTSLAPDELSALEHEVGVAHPAIQASEERIESGHETMRAGKLRNRPDITVGVGWSIVDDRRDAAGIVNPPEGNGQDILGFRVGLNLPIWKTHRRADVDHAEALVDRERYRLSATRNRLEFTAREALLTLVSLDERRRLYVEVLIPQAREALGSAEAAYATNRLEFYDLLDAERVLFEVRRVYQRMVVDSWIAIAEVELALGRAYPAPGEMAMFAADEEGR